MEIQNKDGYTALMGASAMGHLRIVRFLHENLNENGAANISIRNDYKDTPLILAARNGHFPVVQYLLVSGYFFPFYYIMLVLERGFEKHKVSLEGDDNFACG